LHKKTKKPFLQPNTDVACTRYEDCYQSGKTKGIRTGQISAVIKSISVTQQKMFSGKEYSSPSQQLTLTLTISGHKSGVRVMETIQVPNRVQEKTSLISRA